MSTTVVVYFLRLSGRLGSFITGALATGAGVSSTTGGGVPKSTAGVASGSAKAPPSFAGIGSIVGAGAGCEISGDGVIHCGWAGTLTSGAVPNPAIFPLHLFR